MTVDKDKCIIQSTKQATHFWHKWNPIPFCINHKIAVSFSVEEVQTFLSLIAEERIQQDINGATRNKKSLMYILLNLVYF